jgi:Ca2+/Na+ antiporter
VPNIKIKLLEIAKIISFYLTIGIIFLIFLFNQILGIWLAGSFFIIYFVYYLITLSSKRRTLKEMQDYLIIYDKEVAEKLQRPLDDIRKAMSSLSKHQKKKKWLIVFLNNRYIFLNEKGVENFKQLYNRGFNEKKILENLQQEMKIKSRAEINAIITTLISHERLSN